MKKKIKISLILSLAIIFGCFSNVFAEANQNNKAKKIAEVKKSVKLLDNQTQIQPIHRYTFDNDNGNTVVDTGTMAGTDGKYNGTAIGTQVVTENKRNFRRFSGKGDYISFNNPVIPTGKKTIKFDIRSNIKPSQNYYYIIFDNTSVNSSLNGWHMSVNENGNLYVYLTNSTNKYNQIFCSSENILDDKWHTIMFTWDGTLNSNSAKLYR